MNDIDTSMLSLKPYAQLQVGMAIAVTVFVSNAQAQTAAFEGESTAMPRPDMDVSSESEAVAILRAAVRGSKILSASVNEEHEAFADKLVAESLAGRRKSRITKRR